jgi:hypothetical protein
VLAHEGGHAIFQESGLKAQTQRDVDSAHLTSGTLDIVNEGFAGVFGNRAHVALFGYGDRNIDCHLMLLSDVNGNLASDNTYYAKRYHVNTAKARAQIEDIKRVLRKDFIPYFARNFGLLGDPNLAVEL